MTRPLPSLSVVISQLTKVRLGLGWNDRELASGEPQQRGTERHDAALEFDQLPLELIHPLHFPLAAACEDPALDLVDIFLKLGNDVEVVIDDLVRDGVQHLGGPACQSRGIGLHGAAQRTQLGVLAAPYGDHEMITEEDHHLTSCHDLRRIGQFLVLHVGDGGNNHEEVIAEHLQLGACMAVRRVFDSYWMQIKLRCQRHQIPIIRGL